MLTHARGIREASDASQSSQRSRGLRVFSTGDLCQGVHDIVDERHHVADDAPAGG